MEYVILVVGLSATLATWDVFRRSFASKERGDAIQHELFELRGRVLSMESAQLVTRNHLSELKSHLNAAKRVR